MFFMTSRAVFSSSYPSPWTEDYAVLGGRSGASSSGAAQPELETDAELAFAFRTAAGLLAEHWHADDVDDSLVLLMLYNYRHALGLGFKFVLRALVDRQHQLRDRTGRSAARDRGEGGHTHELSVLAGYLVQLAPMFRMDRQGDVASLCDEVRVLDPSGQVLRYSMVKRPGGMAVPARPDPLYVDVPECARRAGEAYTALDLLLGRITSVQDWQVNLGPD
ncbi:hypothetical protein AB5J49_47055 [Streptomyces sp. R28]|uniref:Uncharacterized protein n=1 Tax=Streptomyces sp. R28 TaxID=3238628 RepID=A0AB39QD65_9ACTN